MQPEHEPTAPSNPAPAERTRLWDTVLTTTPVVLTVLGTVLAGLSNSEMTLAQYFRTLAAQSQSKVGDQWGFYQAKRIRGTTLDAVLDLLPVQSRPGKGKYAGLSSAVFRLLERLDAAHHALQDFVAAIQTHQAELPPELTRRLAGGNKELERLDPDRRVQVRALIGMCSVTQDFPEMKQAMMLITENRWLEDPDHALSIGKGPVENAVAAMRDNRTEAELLPLVWQITAEEVRTAIEAAESNARNLAASLNKATRLFEQLHSSVAEQLDRTVAFHEQLEHYHDLIDGGGKQVQPMPVDITRALARLQQCDAAALTAAEAVKNVFAGLEKTFTSRRYKREAEDNQHIAYLYEVQVRQESRQADRHRERSVHFFFGMLGAQAGVAISSLSLAARQKSVLWGLAGAAGLTALVFSLYVYLFV